MNPIVPVQVFVSYSTNDLAYAQQVQRAIRNLGFRVFLAETSVSAGTSLASIREQLCHSHLFVLLWSDGASKSEWVRDEVGAAWGRRMPVIPALLTEGLELPPSLRLNGCKYLNAVTRNTESILNLQSAVIAWWQGWLQMHAAQRAALVEAQRQQQDAANKNFLGLVAIGALAAAALSSS